jgi:hypothetical protein
LPLLEKGLPFTVDMLDLMASGILEGLGEKDTGAGRLWVVVVRFGVDVLVGNDIFSLKFSTTKGKGANPVSFNGSIICGNLESCSKLARRPIHSLGRDIPFGILTSLWYQGDIQFHRFTMLSAARSSWLLR